MRFDKPRSDQLDLAGRGNEDVAAIAWLGYDPPDTTDGSAIEALGERRANEAAPDLAEFYRGINATNEHGSDVHLSAFGHSYGSVATAQALNELGAAGVVDDAAFYGSPGLGHTDETVGWGPLERAVPIMNESDLNMADRHVYVMSSPDDPVSGDPTLLGVPVPGLGDFEPAGAEPADAAVRAGVDRRRDHRHRPGAAGRLARTLRLSALDRQWAAHRRV